MSLKSTAPTSGLVAGAYLRQAQLLRIVPFSSATLWRLVGAGNFPKPVKLAPGVTAWEADAVISWLEERKREAA